MLSLYAYANVQIAYDKEILMHALYALKNGKIVYNNNTLMRAMYALAKMTKPNTSLT